MKTLKAAGLGLLIFAATLTLTACGNDRPSLDDRITSETRTYSGTLETATLDIYSGGSHQLTTDDGVTVFLQSQVFNLNRYLGKKVTVKGLTEESNGKVLLTVDSITIDNGDSGDSSTYDNQPLGFQFSYPSYWQATETVSGVSLNEDETARVKVEVISTEQSLEDYVKAKETESGTPVTVSAQKSMRFTEGGAVRVYVPNTAKGKIYKIIFNAPENGDSAATQAFYDLLESFTIYYSPVSLSGTPCGGEKKLSCPDGYRCELEGRDANAEGHCRSLTGNDENLNCPFIAAPQNCAKYEVAASNKEGCPTRYVCLDAGSSASTTAETGTATDTAVSGSAFDQARLLDVIAENKAGLIGPDITIVQYEVSEEALLIAAVYRDKDQQKHKVLWSYDARYQLTEKARFDQGERTDWTLVSGADAQAGKKKTVIPVSRDVSQIKVVNENMSLYESSQKGFSIQYPKNWYYKNFGAVNAGRWMVGFGDKEVDVIGDAVVTLSLVGMPDNPAVLNPAAAGQYKAVKMESDSSAFLLEGPEALKATIDLMKDSIKVEQ